MTNTEAITKLTNIMHDDHYAWHPSIQTAFNMAVDALRGLPSAQPSFPQRHENDCISRAEAIDVVRKWFDKIELNGDICIDGIISLPSAQPEQRWIPVTERLPENRVYVLATYRYEYGLIDCGITWYGEAEKKWNTSRDVIAWMPLPEPARLDGE